MLSVFRISLTIQQSLKVLIDGHNLNNWETLAGGSWVQAQPGVHNKTLSLKYMFVCMPRYEKYLDSFLSVSEVSSTLSFPTLGSRKLLSGCWANVTNACLPWELKAAEWMPIDAPYLMWLLWELQGLWLHNSQKALAKHIKQIVLTIIRSSSHDEFWSKS